MEKINEIYEFLYEYKIVPRYGMNVLKRYTNDKSIWDDFSNEFFLYLITEIDPNILLRLESEDPTHKRLTAFVRTLVMRFVTMTGKGRTLRKLLDNQGNNVEIREYIRNNEESESEDNEE